MTDGFDPVIGALNTSLNLRLLNNNVITANVANSDTPGYKAKTVEFEGALRQALNVGGELKLAQTSGGHRVPHETDPVNPEIYDNPNGVESLDGNTVDRSSELAKLAENTVLYESSVELLKKKLGMLKYAITEGGGNR